MFDVVQGLDRAAVMALNALAPQTLEVDRAVVWITFHDLLRGGVAMALLRAAWLRRGLGFELRESRILEALLGGAVAVVLGRAMQLLLPHRPRTLHDPDGLRRHAEAHPRAVMAVLFLGTFELAQPFEILRSIAWSFLGISL